jgi:hypothetical protein
MGEIEDKSQNRKVNHVHCRYVLVLVDFVDRVQRIEQNEKNPLGFLELGCIILPPLLAPFLPFDLPVWEFGRV